MRYFHYDQSRGGAVPLLGDLRDLTEAHREALARHGGAAGHFGCGVFDRQRQRREMEARLYALAQLWLSRDVKPDVKRDVSQRLLSERIERFLAELFVFVEHPDLSVKRVVTARSAP